MGPAAQASTAQRNAQQRGGQSLVAAGRRGAPQRKERERIRHVRALHSLLWHLACTQHGKSVPWAGLLFLSSSIVADLMLYFRRTLNCHFDKSFKLVPTENGTPDRRLIYYELSIKGERKKKLNFGVK